MVWINGKAVEAEGERLSQAVEALCAQQGIDPQAVAVLLNGEVWTQDRWPERLLTEGDVVEVVTLMQGG